MCVQSLPSTVVHAPFFIQTICCFDVCYNFLNLNHSEVHIFNWKVPPPLLLPFLGKIEVKILTRKNAEEAGDQWLTEEDTKSFRELLINLLVI